jgi:hypothetical protein
MNSIIIIGLTTLTVSFAIAYSVTLYRVTKINQAFTKLFISHESLQDFITKNNVEFIKFLSDSRDWAYQYIEDVQKSIDSIVEKTADTVKYHKDFGSLAIEPYGTQLNVLVDAIEELKTLLPKEEVK